MTTQSFSSVLFAIVLLPLLTVNSSAHASVDSAQQKGYEIAARSDRSDRGFTNSEVSMEMVLHNAAGKQSRRTMSQKTLEVPNEDLGDKSLVVFSSPGDVDGTALLSFAKILDADDQWLYLPALKRVKRISSANKSGPFVGSEFAFEDLTALELKKYDYKFLRSEECGELTCDVVERYPAYKHSGYTKQVSWVDQNTFQLRRVEYYDRRGDLLKTLTLEDYRLYEGTYWRAHKLAMNNHQTGKSTDLVYGEYKFKTALIERDFSKNSLKRLR